MAGITREAEAVRARGQHRHDLSVPEFEIEFKDIPAAVQDGIREALRAFNPEQDCIEDNSFRVMGNKKGKYELTCIQHGNAGNHRLLSGPIDETEPAAIAKRLLELTER